MIAAQDNHWQVSWRRKIMETAAMWNACVSVLSCSVPFNPGQAACLCTNELYQISWSSYKPYHSLIKKNYFKLISDIIVNDYTTKILWNFDIYFLKIKFMLYLIDLSLFTPRSKKVVPLPKLDSAMQNGN